MQSSTFTLETMKRVTPLLSKLAVGEREQHIASTHGDLVNWMEANHAVSMNLVDDYTALVRRALLVLDEATAIIGGAA